MTNLSGPQPDNSAHNEIRQIAPMRRVQNAPDHLAGQFCIVDLLLVIAIRPT
jgi:hypothetical protein